MNGATNPDAPVGSPGKAGRPSVSSGSVSEIFCSVQGEGLYVGERHVFFRTAGCTAACYWCDSVSSKEDRAHCAVHGRTRRSLANPLDAKAAAREALTLAREFAPVAAVSITGGEPLEQPDFVAAVAREFRLGGMNVYLETNGLEPEALGLVLPYAEVIAMDIKLPHATGQAHWLAHREFLERATETACFAKIVVDSPTPLGEIREAVRLIADVDRNIPLVLQPESSTYLKARGAPGARKALLRLLDEGQRFGLGHLRDVRVIPQCHKIMRMR